MMIRIEINEDENDNENEDGHPEEQPEEFTIDNSQFTISHPEAVYRSPLTFNRSTLNIKH